MTTYKFEKSRIENHVERIGVDVRPIIEVRGERTKLYDYGTWLTDKWPALYENIVQSPASFLITKNLVFPGKGELAHPTFTLTNRGIVFVFPRLLGEIGEEPNLPESRDIVLVALDEFKKRWPQCKIVRVGKVNEYVFGCEPEHGVDILRARFTKLPAAAVDIMIRLNMPSDDYNRIIEVVPVAKYKMDPGLLTPGEPVDTGIGVKMDFNNREMGEELPRERRLGILHDADAFCGEGLFNFLNGGRSE